MAYFMGQVIGFGLFIFIIYCGCQFLPSSKVERVAQLHIYPCIVEGFRLITLCVVHLIEHLGRIVHIIDVRTVVNHPVQTDACGISLSRHLVVHGQDYTRKCREVIYRVAVYQYSASFGIQSLTQHNIVAQQVIEVALLMGYLYQLAGLAPEPAAEESRSGIVSYPAMNTVALSATNQAAYEVLRDRVTSVAAEGGSTVFFVPVVPKSETYSYAQYAALAEDNDNGVSVGSDSYSYKEYYEKFYLSENKTLDDFVCDMAAYSRYANAYDLSAAAVAQMIKDRFAL